MEQLRATAIEIQDEVQRMSRAQRANIHWLTALVCTAITLLAFVVMDKRSNDRHVAEEIAIAEVKGEIENPLTLDALRENVAVASRLDNFSHEVMILKTEIDEEQTLIDQLRADAADNAEQKEQKKKADPKKKS